MAGDQLHEDRSALSQEALDRHRAISSFMEELEAIDWYDQRLEAAGNAELAQILAHNRDEEKEHASMLLEWLRRHDPGLDAQLRTQLFREGAIQETGEPAAAAAGDGSLGIGSLKGA